MQRQSSSTHHNWRSVPRHCEVCGVLFYARPSVVAKGNGRFCSRACKGAQHGTTEDRFWARVDKASSPHGCWLWTGSRSNGYGMFTENRRGVGAHAYSWRLHRGPIPDGLFVCHNCMAFGAPEDNRLCVNPAHLFLGTHTDNMRDMWDKGVGPSGDRHMSRTKPESLRRGDNHPARLHPERLARGDRNGMRLHPESVLRGERNPNARLDADAVRTIRRRYAAGGVSQAALGTEYGVSQLLISRIVRRKSWEHVI